MRISARKKTSRPRVYAAKGEQASRLRQRKHALSRRFGIDHELLGGSLNQVYRRCGKPGCHCVSDDGHPMWTLTYSVGGLRRVEFIPDDLARELGNYAERGRAFRDAVAEVLSINAQLVSLHKKQRKRPPARTRERK